MIEEIGVITAIDKKDNAQYIWIETQIKTTCGGCQANDNCGTGIVAKAFTPKKEQLYLACDETVSVGQQVKLGIPEESLLMASALVYLLPIVVVLLTAVIAQFVLPQLGLHAEGWVVLSAILAALGCFKQVSVYLKHNKQAEYQPQLIGLLPWHGEAIDFVSVSAATKQ
ncbi:MAG: sigma-E factor negative regulatory protein RseC [Paraglaciecola sp.]|jgi:sigma-E factor negative regulatory protein RseC